MLIEYVLHNRFISFVYLPIDFRNIFDNRFFFFIREVMYIYNIVSMLRIGITVWME